MTSEVNVVRLVVSPRGHWWVRYVTVPGKPYPQMETIARVPLFFGMRDGRHWKRGRRWIW